MGFLRFFLAVAVVLWHCPAGAIPRFIHPALAVECFYAVSGFLIQMVWMEKYSGTPHGRRSFYASRALRIFPLYWLVLLATVLAFHDYRDAPGMWRGGAWWPLLVLIVNNVTLLGQDLLHHIHYLPASYSFLVVDLPSSLPDANGFSLEIVPQSWTIALELYFYLLAPFILLRSNRVVIGLVIASFLARLPLGQYLFMNGWNYSLFPEELGIFLLGSLAYRAYKAMLAQPLPEQARRVVGQLCFLLLASVSFILYYMDLNFLGGDGWELPPFGVTKGYLALLLIFVAVLPAAFFISTHSAADRWIGELSYPVYLLHFFILRAAAHYRWVEPEFVSAFVLGVTILLSIVALYAVDRPMDRLRHRWFKPRKAAFVEGVMVVDGVIPKSASGPISLVIKDKSRDFCSSRLK